MTFTRLLALGRRQMIWLSCVLTCQILAAQPKSTYEKPTFTLKETWTNSSERLICTNGTSQTVSARTAVCQLKFTNDVDLEDIVVFHLGRSNKLRGGDIRISTWKLKVGS